MEYQALYRRYRPQTFDDVIGQDHVTKTLVREVADGKVAHAYLFAGPRGTGKTTTARILAKALNCRDPRSDGTPCGVCETCVAIAEGSSLDVIELDAASHNSVDDIRDMRVSVSTVASVGGARRVFILDEAHMLSKAAGNALLKTLEEPPSHVHFVLATTEPYKLLDTIRSRSQRFDFHPVGVETLVGHLQKVAAAEGFGVEAGSLTAVARHAAGSVRDSLSLLEQVAALGAGTVDLRGVNRALGLADGEVYGRLAGAIETQDARTALELVAGLVSEGVDLRRFVSESLAFFRGVFLAHYAPNLVEVADEPAEVLDEWRQTAKVIPATDVLRVVDQLGDCLVKLREGRDERLMVELTLLKLTRPEAAPDPASLAARLDRLEQRVKRGGAPAAGAARPLGAIPAAESGAGSEAPVTVPPEAAAPADESAPAPAGEAEQETTVAVAETGETARLPAGEVTYEQLEAVWGALFAAVRDDLGSGSRRWAFFRETIPGRVAGSTIFLHVPPGHDFHLEQLQTDEQIAAVATARAVELLGSGVVVSFEAGEGTQEEPPDTRSERAPDRTTLAEAPAEDPTRLVADLLGGELIAEVSGDDD